MHSVICQVYTIEKIDTLPYVGGHRMNYLI